MIITGGYRLLRDRGGMPMIIRRNYHRRDRIKREDIRAGASSARNWSARSDRKKKKKGGEGGGGARRERKAEKIAARITMMQIVPRFHVKCSLALIVSP